MLIDLGGIAKGYAVDRAAEALAAQGIDRAIVNAGGDLRVVGRQPQRVHLRGYNGQLEATIEIADMALATSAARWERRRHRGRTTSPHLGVSRSPVLGGAAVSIVAPTCMVADAMTKVALANPPLATAMLAELGGAIVSRSSMAEAA